MAQLKKMNSTPKFILASSSPRRSELLAEAGFTFEVISLDINEQQPDDLSPTAVVEHLARQKLNACEPWLAKSLVLTADTLVFKDSSILGKPRDRNHAIEMLTELSDSKHTVITSVCLGYQKQVQQFSVATIVAFAKLSNEQIVYYIDNYQPYDKAGSYGIQEWIGKIGVRKIDGSYTNVVGLPMQETYIAIVSLSNQWLK